MIGAWLKPRWCNNIFLTKHLETNYFDFLSHRDLQMVWWPWRKCIILSERKTVFLLAYPSALDETKYCNLKSEREQFLKISYFDSVDTVFLDTCWNFPLLFSGNVFAFVGNQCRDLDFSQIIKKIFSYFMPQTLSSLIKDVLWKQFHCVPHFYLLKSDKHSISLKIEPWL